MQKKKSVFLFIKNSKTNQMKLLWRASWYKVFFEVDSMTESESV